MAALPFKMAALPFMNLAILLSFPPVGNHQADEPWWNIGFSVL
jgi:hypothetical protein